MAELTRQRVVVDTWSKMEAEINRLRQQTHDAAVQLDAVKRGGVRFGMSPTLGGLTLTDIPNAAGNFLTHNGGTVNQRTALEALGDMGGPDLVSLAGLNPGVGDVGSVIAVSAANTYALVAAAPPALHDVLGIAHGDTAANAVLRGALIVGNATPAWSRMSIGAAGTLLRSDGVDASWASLATAGIQPLDADLTAIAALAGTGILCRTGVNTWAERTITSTAGLTVTNPGGVAGDIDIGLTTDTPTLGGLTLPAADGYLYWGGEAVNGSVRLYRPSDGMLSLQTRVFGVWDNLALLRLNTVRSAYVEATALTGNRLVATNVSSYLASVADLSDWIGGTANRITVTDNGSGGVTLNAPQDLHTAAVVQFARMGLGVVAHATIPLSATGSTGVHARFGPSAGRTAIYVNDYLPAIGYNVYYDPVGPNWRYGEGSVDSYAGVLYHNPVDGMLSYQSSAAGGAADAAVVLSSVFTVSRAGAVVCSSTCTAAGLVSTASVQVQLASYLRFGPDDTNNSARISQSVGVFTFESYQGGAWGQSATLVATHAQLDDTGLLYWGASAVNDSWAGARSDTSLAFLRREAGLYVAKLTVGADGSATAVGNVRGATASLGAALITGATLSLGTTASSSTATPLTFNMGGTYANSVGDPTKMKLRIYDDTTSRFGLSVSSNALELFAKADSAFYYYCGTRNIGSLTATGTATILNVIGNSTGPAYLNLTARLGANNGDQWRIRSDQTTNQLQFQNDVSGAQATRVHFTTGGAGVFVGSVTAASVVVADAGTIGSASKTDAITIASTGALTCASTLQATGLSVGRALTTGLLDIYSAAADCIGYFRANTNTKRAAFMAVAAGAAAASDVYLEGIAYGTAHTGGNLFGTDRAGATYVIMERGTKMVVGTASNTPLYLGTNATIRVTISNAGAVTCASTLKATELRASSDIGGEASTTSLTNVTAGVSTGTGTVKMNGSTDRNNTLWVKLYSGTTAVYVPGWSII